MFGFLGGGHAGPPPAAFSPKPLSPLTPQTPPAGLKPLNGTLTTQSGADGQGGIYGVGFSGRGETLFRCLGILDCWELESIAWAPNGKRIAFSVNSYSQPDHGYNGIHVLDPRTGRDEQVIRGEAFVRDLAWAPDGRSLAYADGRIHGVEGIGSVLRTGTTGIDSSPTWSPDGSRIAFANRRSPNRADVSSVWLVRRDGTDRKLLARHASAPAWSPNGRAIAYRTRCGIKLVAPSGRDVTPFGRAQVPGCSHAIGLRGVPIWSPDGRKIAISTHSGLYEMNANGTGLFGRTNEAEITVEGALARPSWQSLYRTIR